MATDKVVAALESDYERGFISVQELEENLFTYFFFEKSKTFEDAEQTASFLTNQMKELYGN